MINAGVASESGFKARDRADQFLLNSGACGHMLRCRSMLYDLRDCAQKIISLGDDLVVEGQHVGSADLVVKDGDGNANTLRLSDVLYVPHLKA